MFWSRVQDPFEVVNDPALRAAGGIVEVPDGVATMPMIATPVDFHGTPWSPRGMAPGLGDEGGAGGRVGLVPRRQVGVDRGFEGGGVEDVVAHGDHDEASPAPWR